MLYTEDEKRKQWDIAREKVKNIIENNDIKGRIKIDRDILEKLLFDVYTFRAKDRYGLKTFTIPAWSGPFLQKIDLSEINFSGVYFDDVSELEDEFQIRIAKEKKSDSEYNVDYSNTNVNIDLSVPKTVFYKCNFENITIHGHYNDAWGRGNTFISCNLKNVKFDDEKFSGSITPRDMDNDLYGQHLFECVNCNMENSNLSRVSRAFHSLVESSTGTCNYKNTGLHIIYDMYDMTRKDGWMDTFSREFKKKLIKILDNGYIEGCYFDVVNMKYGEERDDVDYWKNHNCSVIYGDHDSYYHYLSSEEIVSSNLITSKDQFLELFSHTTLGKEISSLDIQKDYIDNGEFEDKEVVTKKEEKDLADMINDKVEMIASSIDEQIKSKQ